MPIAFIDPRFRIGFAFEPLDDVSEVHESSPVFKQSVIAEIEHVLGKGDRELGRQIQIDWQSDSPTTGASTMFRSGAREVISRVEAPASGPPVDAEGELSHDDQVRRFMRAQLDAAGCDHLEPSQKPRRKECTATPDGWEKRRGYLLYRIADGSLQPWTLAGAVARHAARAETEPGIEPFAAEVAQAIGELQFLLYIEWRSFTSEAQ